MVTERWFVEIFAHLKLAPHFERDPGPVQRGENTLVRLSSSKGEDKLRWCGYWMANIWRKHMPLCDNKRCLIFVVLYWFIFCGRANLLFLPFFSTKKQKNIKHSNLMFVWNSTNAIFGQRLEILEQNGSSTESRPVCSITFSETTAKKHWHLIPLPNDQHGHLFGCSCNLLILTRHFQQVNVSVRLPPVGG